MSLSIPGIFTAIIMFVLTGLTEDGRSVDKKTWKTIQVIMNDTQKFSEVINNLRWDRGLSEDILKTIVSFFAPTETVVHGIAVPKISISNIPSPKHSAVDRRTAGSPGKNRFQIFKSAKLITSPGSGAWAMMHRVCS